MLFPILRALDNFSKRKSNLLKISPKPLQSSEILLVKCRLKNQNEVEEVWLPQKFAKVGISMTFEDNSGSWNVIEVDDRV